MNHVEKREKDYNFEVKNCGTEDPINKERTTRRKAYKGWRWSRSVVCKSEEIPTEHPQASADKGLKNTDPLFIYVGYYNFAMRGMGVVGG